MVKIDLTEEQAHKVRVFLDNHSFFNALIEAGLHKPQHPQYTLYFSKFNVLKRIEAKQITYERE